MLVDFLKKWRLCSICIWSHLIALMREINWSSYGQDLQTSLLTYYQEYKYYVYCELKNAFRHSVPACTNKDVLLCSCLSWTKQLLMLLIWISSFSFVIVGAIVFCIMRMSWELFLVYGKNWDQQSHGKKLSWECGGNWTITTAFLDHSLHLNIYWAWTHIRAPVINTCLTCLVAEKKLILHINGLPPGFFFLKLTI